LAKLERAGKPKQGNGFFKFQVFQIHKKSKLPQSFPRQLFCLNFV